MFSHHSYWRLCVVQWMGSHCIYMATRKSVMQSCHGNKRGKGGEVHFIRAGCVPSWKPTEFLDRGYDEHNQDARWHQDQCVRVSGWQTLQRDEGCCLLPHQSTEGAAWSLASCSRKSVSISSTLHCPRLQVCRGKAGNHWCAREGVSPFGWGHSSPFKVRRSRELQK